MKELLINLLNFFGLAWWIEIVTAAPGCTYYFGPFLRAKEAEAAKAGYIEDLESEGSQVVKLAIARMKPRKLTVTNDELEKNSEPLGSQSFTSAAKSVIQT